MSTEKHTQGRLEVVDSRRISIVLPNEIGGGFDSHCVALAFNTDGRLDADANARRLVACWNACEGAKTEDLEALGPQFIEPVIKLIDQRDELLVSLERLLGKSEAEGWAYSAEEREIARSAIAKVKGGAA